MAAAAVRTVCALIRTDAAATPKYGLITATTTAGSGSSAGGGGDSTASAVLSAFVNSDLKSIHRTQKNQKLSARCFGATPFIDPVTNEQTVLIADTDSSVIHQYFIQRRMYHASPHRLSP